jgi:F0F1-type ATP synthase membrane subunit b/b'
MTTLFHSSSFYLTLSFVVFCFLLYYFLTPHVRSYLKTEFLLIKREVELAKERHLDAQEKLKTTLSSLNNIDTMIEEILNKAQEKIKLLSKNVSQETEMEIKRQQKKCEKQLDLMKQKTLCQCKNLLAEMILHKLLREFETLKPEKRAELHLTYLNKSLEKFEQLF